MTLLLDRAVPPPAGDYPPAFVEPTFRWVPERRGTYGPEIVDFAASIGHPVDAEQAADIDAFASFGVGGTYLTLETVHLEARQNGKTDRTALPIALADVWLFGNEVTWTAHRLETVQDVRKTVARLVEENPALSRRIKSQVDQRSEWSYELFNGGILEFRVRGSGSGRGIPRDIWICDEALFMAADAMGDRLPTLSSRPNPQVRYVSSAAKPSSGHLHSLIRRGRAGGDRSLIYVERCAPGGFDEPGCERGKDCPHTLGSPGCTLDREDLWHLANHRAGRRPGASYQFLRAERRAFAAKPHDWARERLGWHERQESTGSPIRVADWAACQVQRPLPESARIMFVNVAEDQAAAAIAAAWLDHEGRPRAELVDTRPGVAWLPGRCAELRKGLARSASWWCDSEAVLSSVPTIRSEASVTLRPVQATAMAAACGYLQKVVTDRAVTIQPAQPLDVAFDAAVKKDVGDGRWIWAQRKSTVDISPLVAVTGALWQLESGASLRMIF